METAIVLVLFALVVIFDLLPFKKRAKKNNVVYCVILIVSFFVLFLHTLGVEIPHLADPISQLLSPLVSG